MYRSLYYSLVLSLAVLVSACDNKCMTDADCPDNAPRCIVPAKGMPGMCQGCRNDKDCRNGQACMGGTPSGDGNCESADQMMSMPGSSNCRRMYECLITCMGLPDNNQDCGGGPTDITKLCAQSTQATANEVSNAQALVLCAYQHAGILNASCVNSPNVTGCVGTKNAASLGGFCAAEQAACP